MEVSSTSLRPSCSFSVLRAPREAIRNRVSSLSLLGSSARNGSLSRIRYRGILALLFFFFSFSFAVSIDFYYEPPVIVFNFFVPFLTILNLQFENKLIKKCTRF